MTTSMETERSGHVGDGRGSLLANAAALLGRNARLIGGVALVVMMTTAAAMMLLGREYTAQSTIVPEANDANALPLAGLAANLGVSLAGLQGSESVDFYARLLQSRQLLEAAGQSQYEFEPEPGSGRVVRGTLLEIYDIEGESERERVQKLVKRLSEDVSVGTDLRANLVGITTTAPWPLLAEQLNARLLELMGDFNVEKRQTKAASEREFVQSRMAEARSELGSAETALRDFRERNRRVGNAPDLELEADRLEREVGLRQQVYTSLAQAYEQARIDEVRNTPVFTVVDPPERSARPNRGLIPTLVVAFAVGMLTGLGFALARELLQRLRAQQRAARVGSARRDSALADVSSAP